LYVSRTWILHFISIYRYKISMHEICTFHACWSYKNQKHVLVKKLYRLLMWFEITRSFSWKSDFCVALCLQAKYKNKNFICLNGCTQTLLWEASQYYECLNCKIFHFHIIEIKFLDTSDIHNGVIDSIYDRWLYSQI
jgi:hypothetical protein